MTQEKSPQNDGNPRTSGRASVDAVSAQRRTQLAKDFLLEVDVLTKLDVDQEALAALRRARKILAVWQAPESRYVYPPFQFDDVGIIAGLELLLLYLREGSSGSGWSEIEWLMTPHALLEARAPADLLPLDPNKVLGAAETEFSKERDSDW